MKHVGIAALIVGLASIAVSALYTGQRLKRCSVLEGQFLQRIEADLEIVEERIANARSESETYEMGLVADLLRTRLEILRVTRDLLHQRKVGREYLMTINYDRVEPGYKDEAEQARLLEEINREIQEQETELVRAQAKSEIYSGGLVGTLADAAVIGIESGIALLEARRIAVEYDVPLFLAPPLEDAGGQVGSSPAPPDMSSHDTGLDEEPPAASYWVKSRTVNVRSGPSTEEAILCQLEQGDKVYRMQQQDEWQEIRLAGQMEALGWIHSSLISESFVAPAPDIEITEIDYRTTEKNNTWWKFSWRLTVTNSGNMPRALSATIEFQDSDGFILDEDSEFNLYLPARDERTFTGYILIDADIAWRVAQVLARVK